MSIRARPNDTLSAKFKGSSRAAAVERPRIAAATTTSTAQVRVALCHSATHEDCAGHTGIGRIVRVECVWGKKNSIHFYSTLPRMKTVPDIPA